MSSDPGNETDGYLPIMYQEENPYWEALREGVLRLQKCSGCGHIRYPIGPACPKCLSPEFEWAEMSGRGEVSTYVVFHKAWAPWLASKVPYAVVQVQLDEGPRLTTNLAGVDPQDVRIGMKVEATFEKRTEEVTLLQFTPAA